MSRGRRRWIAWVGALALGGVACSAAQPDAPAQRPATVTSNASPRSLRAVRTHEPRPAEEAAENRDRCAGGDPASCHAAALDAYYRPASPTTDRDAYDYFKRSCDAGYAPSCNGLGVLYSEGRGVLHDDVEAARLYRGACDDGATTACEHLSAVLESGVGVTRDPAAAARAHARSRCVFDASLYKRSLASCPSVDEADAGG